ncbi:peptide deformylase [Methylophaga sp. 42_25_T18]|nr:peptide deformylase [Methylophaga sp. 42_25_T18]
MNKNNFDILQLGHPHLRRTSTAISDLSSAYFQSFIDSLLQFVIDKGGMGIAAAQVDVAQRVFIMCSRPNSRYPDAPEMAPTIVINPEIMWASEEKKKDWEGCLSLPGIRGLVPRHHTIKVKYLSRTGAAIEAEYTSFIARIFQHELDHLNGIVFLDRVESTDEIMMEQEWQKRFAKA